MIDLGPRAFEPNDEDTRQVARACRLLANAAEALLGRPNGFGKPTITLDIQAGRVQNVALGGTPLLREVRKKAGTAS